MRGDDCEVNESGSVFQDPMITLLRIILGALFVGHGTQKLFGWFGGHGPDGTGQFFENLGLRPGQAQRARRRRGRGGRRRPPRRRPRHPAGRRGASPAR